MTHPHTSEDLNGIQHGTEQVDGLEIFYREAGDPGKPALVLLHGFPSSSHMYRDLLSRLGNDYHLIAPDYPGYGYSDKPNVDDYDYTFDNVATTMDRFLSQRGLDKFAMLIHDFGAPIGFRIASKHPEKITGIIAMNGNAYEEGLSDTVRETLKLTRSDENDEIITQNYMSTEGIKALYTTGVKNIDRISPDNWHFDRSIMAQPGVEDLSLEMIYDYPNNVKLYPEWQAYLREHQPPMLILWGKNDPIFPEPGAEAYKKDVKDIDYNILDTGHFTLEEFAPLVVKKVRSFMKEKLRK